MADIATLNLTLRFADGTERPLTVDSTRALVGSGAHCEVRLRPEDADHEQLELVADAAGLFARARGTRPILLDGELFGEGELSPQARLSIGSVELSAKVVTTSFGGSRRGSETSGNPLIYALGALGFPLGFYLLLTGNQGDQKLPQAVEPPPLWTAQAATCPETNHEAALALAQDSLLRAESARERSPFSREQGVLAVDMFGRASACFQTGGDPPRSGAAALAARQVKEQVEHEFHVHRVRLERDLTTKSYDDARTEVRILLSFVGRGAGKYADWLSMLDRQIELKFSGKK